MALSVPLEQRAQDSIAKCNEIACIVWALQCLNIPAAWFSRVPACSCSEAACNEHESVLSDLEPMHAGHCIFDHECGLAHPTTPAFLMCIHILCQVHTWTLRKIRRAHDLAQLARADPSFMCL